MQTFNSFDELAAAQNTAPLVSDMSVFNGARAADFRAKREKLRDERGALTVADLELPENLAAIIGSWDEDDIVAASRYLTDILETRRQVGAEAKVKAAALLAQLDKISYQRKLPPMGDMPDQWDQRMAELNKLERAKNRVDKSGNYDPETGDSLSWTERAAFRKEMKQKMERMIPQFSEVKQMLDSGNLTGIRRRMHEAQDYFETAELRLKQFERRVPDRYDPKDEYDQKSLQRDLQDLRDTLTDYKTKYEKIKTQYEEAVAYGQSS